MSQPDPAAQQAQQAQQEAQAGLLAAQTDDLKASAMSKTANAQKTQIEAQLMPEEHRVKIVQAAATNLDQGDSFEKRLKIADLMLKEKQVNLKENDILSNERIASLQMINKQK
jgi:hypothetical protein